MRKHEFLVTIEGSFERLVAEWLLEEIGAKLGSLPPEERVSFKMTARPILGAKVVVEKHYD